MIDSQCDCNTAASGRFDPPKDGREMIVGKESGSPVAALQANTARARCIAQDPIDPRDVRSGQQRDVRPRGAPPRLATEPQASRLKQQCPPVESSRLPEDSQ